MKNLIFILKSLQPLLKDKKLFGYFVLSVIVLILGILSNIFTPIVFKALIDKLYLQKYNLIWLLAISYSVLWTISQSNMHIKEFFSNKVELGVSTFLVEKCINCIFKLPFTKFHSKSAADMFNIIQRTQNAIPFIFMQLSFYIIPVVIEVAAMTFILIKYYKLVYGIILVITLTFFLLYNLFFQKNLDILSRKIVEIDSATNEKELDLFINYESIKSYSSEVNASKLIHKQLEVRKNIFIQVRSRYSLVRCGQVIVLGGGVFIVSIFITNDVKQGDIPPGSFILLIGYLVQLIAPINAIGYTIKDFRKSLIELEDAVTLMQSDINNDESKKCLTSNILNIEFKNVSLTYKNHQALNNFSLSIPYAKKIALVGPSGIGKSTIAKLILGLYSPDVGEVSINNNNINTLNSSYLRKVITYIPQDTQLLNASLKANLLFTTNHSVSDKQIFEAIKLATLDQFVNQRLQGNIENKIGDRGIQISGGEKQRIGIARLFLRINSEIIILDEPFSALDKKTSEAIFTNIYAHFQSKTIIIITHKILKSISENFEIITISKS